MNLNLRPAVICFFVIAIIVVLSAAYYLFGRASEPCAIDLVQNNVTDTYDLDGTTQIETTGDLVQTDVRNLWWIGLQAREIWDSVENSEGWQVVMVRVEYKVHKWEELYTMRWRVNLETNEIVPLDNTARTYLGGG